MHRRTVTLLLCAGLIIMGMGALSAYAASGYARVNFNFAAPAKLKASVTGSTATLDFDKPVQQSAAAIKAALPGYVKSVALSPDKRHVTLVMMKSYRLRQFVSGNSTGIDLIGEPASAAEVAATEKKAAQTPSAKPTGKKPVTPPKTKLVAMPAKPAPLTTNSNADLLTTKHPVSTVPTAATDAEKALAPASIAQKSADDSILTTKHASPVQALEPTPQQPKDGTSTVATAAADAAKATAPKTTAEAPASTPTAPKAPVITPEEDTTEGAPSAPSPATDHKPATSVPEAEEHPAPAITSIVKPTSAGPFVIAVKATKDSTVLDFPWTERTAAVVFKRTRSIWVVFSRAKQVDLPKLRASMPKSVVNVIQFNYGGNTVLEFVTDGTLNPAMEQVKGGYGWNLTLGPNPGKPTLDTTIMPDDFSGTTRLILGAYDISPAVRFYDPNVGDELILVPSYENGRAVLNERNFPELSVLTSTQGIAIVARRHDITASQTRNGLVLAAKDGLTISTRLPMVEGTSAVVGTVSTGVMLPYDQWFIPREKFADTAASRLNAIGHASKSARPAALFELAKLYLQDGRGLEAGGVLQLIKEGYPQYYVANKLALLAAAAHVMENHIPEATLDLQAPELATTDEAWPWREVVALSTPPPGTVQQIQQSVEAANATKTVGTDSAKNLPGPVAPALPAEKPAFHFLKYNKLYIRFYPPRIRQRLAKIAADAYLADNQEEKALATFNTLLTDDLLGPVKNDAAFALAAVAEKKGETDKALDQYGALAKQPSDLYNQARARAAMLRLLYAKGKLTADEAANQLESVRMSWRGDALERQILSELASIYNDAKRYDDVLRTDRDILEGFPNDPNTLTVATDMGELFEHIFLDGLDKDMKPLDALSLFYEFREMTPLGDKGDKIIQQLANRLAAIDLLDRATQLLDNQIKYRVAGQERSEIGARLALLHILNHHPQDALDVLETTNFGNNAPELQVKRQELTAEALMKLGKNEEALGVITNDTSKTGSLLRLDILWAMQDWPNVVSHAEDILAARQSLTEPLSSQEAEVLLKLALGYTFEGDNTQLRYLRDYYSGLIPDSAYKQIFDYITNDTTPLDPADFALIAKQISHTESFLDQFKKKIAAGKLSETIK